MAETVKSAEVKPAAAAPAPAASGSSMDPKLAGVLAWLFAPLSSLVLILVEKDNKFIKHHAWQSLVFGITMVALQVIAVPLYFVIIGLCVSTIGGVLWLVGIIMGIVKATQNETWKLPVIGDWAEDQANK